MYSSNCAKLVSCAVLEQGRDFVYVKQPGGMISTMVWYFGFSFTNIGINAFKKHQF